MNLSDIPYGPLTATSAKTFEVLQTVYDRKRKRMLNRTLLITGSDAFGLPRPIDDQVLLGLTTITSELGFASRKVEFSRYHLCRVLRWKPDGRTYRRIEESLDRIAGATLKFKDGWWDKGEEQWRSHTFHILDNVELCSKDRYEVVRLNTSAKEQALCSVVWNEVIWKSFKDGFIRKLDMELLARVAKGKRRDAAVRLFRVLDKHFYFKDRQTWEVRKLCVGTLGSQSKYVSKMLPVLEKAVKILIDVGYLESAKYYLDKSSQWKVAFVKARKSAKKRGATEAKPGCPENTQKTMNKDTAWLTGYSEAELESLELHALQGGFGSRLERGLVEDERKKGTTLADARPVRLHFLKRFLDEAEHGANRSKQSR